MNQKKLESEVLTDLSLVFSCSIIYTLLVAKATSALKVCCIQFRSFLVQVSLSRCRDTIMESNC